MRRCWFALLLAATLFVCTNGPRMLTKNGHHYLILPKTCGQVVQVHPSGAMDIVWEVGWLREAGGTTGEYQIGEGQVPPAQVYLMGYTI